MSAVSEMKAGQTVERKSTMVLFRKAWGLGRKDG